jgi:hypothetical protein
MAARDQPGMSATEIGCWAVEGLAWVETRRTLKAERTAGFRLHSLRSCHSAFDPTQPYTGLLCETGSGHGAAGALRLPIAAKVDQRHRQPARSKRS